MSKTELKIFEEFEHEILLFSFVELGHFSEEKERNLRENPSVDAKNI